MKYRIGTVEIALGCQFHFFPISLVNDVNRLIPYTMSTIIPVKRPRLSQPSERHRNRLTVLTVKSSGPMLPRIIFQRWNDLSVRQALQRPSTTGISSMRWSTRPSQPLTTGHIVLLPSSTAKTNELSVRESLPSASLTVSILAERQIVRPLLTV